MTVKLIAVALAAGLLIGGACPATAAPSLPSSFWGTITANGPNPTVLSGTPIRALIDGQPYAIGVTGFYAGHATYTLNVPGDDPFTTSVVEGGHDGDTIVFEVGGIVADQVGTWWLGSNVELNLTFTPPSAPPPLPSSFWGTVTAAGPNPAVPPGTLIQVLIGGQVYAQGYTQSYQGLTVYALNVPGDDPTTTPGIEGGHEGEAIQFRVGDVVADQRAVWHEGTNVELNLTMSRPTAVALASFQVYGSTAGFPPSGWMWPASSVGLAVLVVLAWQRRSR